MQYILGLDTRTMTACEVAALDLAHSNGKMQPHARLSRVSAFGALNLVIALIS
jgi:hypothetical protein